MLSDPRILANLVEELGIGAWEWSPATDQLFLNKRACVLLGLPAESQADRASWRHAVHPEDVAIWDRRYANTKRNLEAEASIEYRLRHQDSWLWVEDRLAVTARDAAGHPQSYGGLWLSADARKQNEAGLMQSMAALENALHERRSAQSNFSDLATVSDAWLWSQDADLRFNRHSRGEHSPQYQVSSRAMLGRSYREWLDENPGLREGADWSIVLDAQAARQPFTNFVFSLPLRRQDGVQWCRISGTPLFDEAGQFTGYKGVGADITELYLARARAEEASKAKSAFLAHMSHEIRTPLHGVLGMAEVLEAALSNPQHQQMAHTIRRSGESLMSILNDVLDMSKIEAGRIELETIAFDPLDLVQRVKALHNHTAEAKGLEFDLMLGAGSATRRLGDPLRLQQILHNLISNALKFTETGRVLIRVSHRSDRPLICEVSDTGIGMTQDQIDHIFDPFTQGDSSITRRFGGTGLGMTITQELVALMGGKLTLTSAPGEGTSVKVELPLEALPAEDQPGA